MPGLNYYVGLATTKAALGIPSSDTADDTLLKWAIHTVSRNIDMAYGRPHFYVALRTLYFTAVQSSRLLLPVDLLSVTTLKTDPDGDRTYANTWTTSDYDLEPVNAVYMSPPAPYWEIVRRSDGDYSFPTCARGVEIAGKVGRYEVLRTPSSTLNANLNTTETAITVTSGSAFEVGQTILIDSEQMWISAISSNTLTVTRGVNGTTAATHTSGATIQIYEYPVVQDAVLKQAQLSFRRDATSTGEIGAAGRFQAQSIIRAGLHPFVKDELAMFRVPVFA